MKRIIIALCFIAGLTGCGTTTEWQRGNPVVMQAQKGGPRIARGLRGIEFGLRSDGVVVWAPTRRTNSFPELPKGGK